MIKVKDADVAFYKDVMIVSWDIDKIGFGAFTFYLKNHCLYLDSETMSKAIVKAVLCKLVDRAKDSCEDVL